jgi:hypothetical protein
MLILALVAAALAGVGLGIYIAGTRRFDNWVDPPTTTGIPELSIEARINPDGTAQIISGEFVNPEEPTTVSGTVPMRVR